MHKNSPSPGGKFCGNGEKSFHTLSRNVGPLGVGKKERKSMDIVAFLGEFPSCASGERVVY